jgi:hypothetical protein
MKPLILISAALIFFATAAHAQDNSHGVDRAWYIVAPSAGGCVALNVAMPGANAPEDIQRLAIASGEASRLRYNGPDMALMVDPTGRTDTIAMARGQSTCEIALKLVEAAR